MELDVRPIVMQCRIFEQGGSYENRDTFLGSFNVTINGNEAHISMLQGMWSRDIHEMLRRQLSTLGVEVLEYESKGTKKARPILFPMESQNG